MLDFIICKLCLWASLVAHVIKNLPAMQETWVQSLGWEYPLEKEMATHSSTLAWRIPWPEEPGRLHSPWSCNSRTQLSTKLPDYALIILFFKKTNPAAKSILNGETLSTFLWQTAGEAVCSLHLYSSVSS